MDCLQERVKSLARRHNLEHKVDFDNLSDDEYVVSWERVLSEYERFVVNLPSADNDTTLYSMGDVKGYTASPRAAIDRVRSELHEGFSDFPAVTKGPNVCKVVPPSNVPPDVGSLVSTVAHVIDVDYEYVDGDMTVLLYTRDVNSARTNLVMCEYRDYFYIELNDEVTAHVARKAVDGYAWFLQNVRYPEAEKRYYDNDGAVADPRRHESQINHRGGPLVLDMVEVDSLKSMYGFKPGGQRFLKVVTANPTVTTHLFQGLGKKYAGGLVDTKKGPTYFPEMKFYEATTDVINKFLTEHKLAGCVGVEVEGTVVANSLSTCDRAIRASRVRLAPDAPFYEPRVMFYDIECLSHDVNVFPSADLCPCIQISYRLVNGSSVEREGVLCYKETPGYEWYETEEQMLIRFAQIVLEFNPDAITGFNSNNFDMPYIIDRMKVLGVYKLAGVLSRRKGFLVDYKREKKQSKQFGTKEIVKYTIPGRIMMDQFEIIKGDPTKRLRSYSLKSICAEYLGDDNKEDLAYKDIPSLFETAEGRQKIASYCLQDTVLLHKLDQKMMLGITAWGMTKVLGVTPDVTLNRGLVHKLMAKLKQYTEEYGLLIPSFTKAQKPVFQGKYQGAFVLDPDIGYYEDPVVVLDFASLYPALMIGWNLCYTTIVMDKEWMADNPDAWEMHCGTAFVKHSTYKGIVPRLEEEMAAQRKAAKKKMARAKVTLAEHQARATAYQGGDEAERRRLLARVGEYEVQVAIYDSEQLANKIIMNSLYGMLGSPTATVPCVDIAKTITGLGRENLLAAKNYVEANYCSITGEKDNCKVIYGDTDSIFIKMPGIAVAKAIAYGQQIDKRVQQDIFSHRQPMKMEYEKTYSPFIITRRKGYCGAKYEFNDKDFKVAAMGFQLVRRDAAQLCASTMKTYFDYVFKEKNRAKAAESVRAVLTELFGELLPLEDYVITKKIAKAEYKTTPPHVLAWNRMVGRVGKAEAPAVGERFEYVVTKMNKKLGKDLSQAMMDLPLARRNPAAVEIDKDYYFTTFIQNPMQKIMELIHGAEETRKILDPKAYERKDTVVASKKNILGFFGKKQLVSKKRHRGLGFDEAFLREIKDKRARSAQQEGWELI